MLVGIMQVFAEMVKNFVTSPEYTLYIAIASVPARVSKSVYNFIFIAEIT